MHLSLHDPSLSPLWQLLPYIALPCPATPQWLAIPPPPSLSPHPTPYSDYLVFLLAADDALNVQPFFTPVAVHTDDNQPPEWVRVNITGKAPGRSSGQVRGPRTEQRETEVGQGRAGHGTAGRKAAYKPACPRCMPAHERPCILLLPRPGQGAGPSML